MSFGGGSFNYFDAATGSNAYERQSWRDSFNGGRAAGDWTGNVNASLTAEREAFGGATWSGSSTQPSALQLAQSFVGQGPAVGSVATGGNTSSGVGPGTGVVSTAPVVTVPTKGPGRQVVVSGGGPFTPKLKTEVTQFQIGGVTMRPHTGTSNMEEVEERWGDAEFLSPAWFASWGIAGVDIVSNVNAMRSDVGNSMMSSVDGAFEWVRTRETSAPRRVTTPSDAGGFGLGAFTPFSPASSGW